MNDPKKPPFWLARSMHVKSGSDAIFQDPDVFLEAASEYFVWNDENPLISVEQAKNPPKPYMDDFGDMVYPSPLIEIPKMRPLTMHGLCGFLGVTTLYFRDFEEKLSGDNSEKARRFSQFIAHIKEMIYRQKFDGSASGFLNPNIIARDLGLVDRSETKVSAKVKKVDLSKLSDATLNELAAAGTKQIDK